MGVLQQTGMIVIEARACEFQVCNASSGLLWPGCKLVKLFIATYVVLKGKVGTANKDRRQCIVPEQIFESYRGSISH